MSIDLISGWLDANSRIEAIKTQNEVSKSEKDLKKSKGNSHSKSAANISTQLNKISEQQKRFQREAPTSMDNMLNMFNITSGSGLNSTKYLRKILLETAVKIEPSIQEILSQEAINVLGCSHEQTYVGVINPNNTSSQFDSLDLLPISSGLYIPINSLDFMSNLKNSPETKTGKVYYEYPEPSVNPFFKPYGGNAPYPMNKELFLRTQTSNSYKTQWQKYYQGVSGQDLFDIQYSKVNGFGVSGDYYRIGLVDRMGGNKVGEFLKDYYGTIKMIDSVSIGAQLVNLLTGAINTQSKAGIDEITNQSKFFTVATRVLGLCFDSKTEIDVSGVSKIAELDGVDNDFFKLNEVDLRNIDLNASNVLNGVVEFEDCGNVKLPVNYEILVDELVNFRAIESGQTPEQNVKVLETIIDSISQNPDWKIYGPTLTSVAINKNVLKQIPLAVAAGVLTPKVLLPIFTLMQVVQSGATNTYNKAITSANTNIHSANTILSSGNTVGEQINNIINNGLDFLLQFRKFSIQVISKISSIFLKTLFELLKKDIINLLSAVIKDIIKGLSEKRIARILRLVQILYAVLQLISDYRKCKSLLDDIKTILNLINGFSIGRKKIPLPLCLISDILPGTSPDRASINTIQTLQQLGIPTGTLPDGTPNLMLLYNLAIHKGSEKEKSENAALDAYVLSPAGPLPVVGFPV
jgi:hypothetical protein